LGKTRAVLWKERGLALFLVVVFIFLASKGRGQGLQALEGTAKSLRSEELKEQVRKAREELREILRRQKTLVGHLDNIDRAVNRHRREILRLQAEIDSAKRRLRRTYEELGRLEKERRLLLEGLRDRLVVLYKARRLAYAGFVLSASSLQDADRRFRYLACIIRQDAERLRSLQAHMEQWMEARKALEERKRRLVALQVEKNRQLKEMEDKRERKERLLAALRDRKEFQEQLLKDLEEASKRLQSLVHSLKDKGPSRQSVSPWVGKAGRSFGGRKGHLPRPVNGPIRRKFGKEFHPLLNTYTWNHGIEIAAPEGTPIRAVHGGEVVFSGWLKGYGNVLIIDHGEGFYTLHGHASRLVKGVGEYVQAGEVIGFVGETGSLTGPSLYFEIRKMGRPVDPLAWFEKEKKTASGGTLGR